MIDAREVALLLDCEQNSRDASSKIDLSFLNFNSNHIQTYVAALDKARQLESLLMYINVQMKLIRNGKSMLEPNFVITKLYIV